MALAKRARLAYEPYGVVGVIGAGSAPFAQPLGQIAGALLAGNAVAFKPARRACLAGERIARVLARAGLPEGLVRLVHGGAQVGVALARSPVNKVLFTGSPAVGRTVARACVSQDKEVTVELGGKDAMLVLADAHVPRAVSGALWAGCAAAGQARGSVERIYVERELYDRFLTRLVNGAQALRIGDPGRAGRADWPAGLTAALRACAGAGRGGRCAGRDAALRRAPRADAAGLRAKRRLLCAGGSERGDPRDAADARAPRRAGLAVMSGRLGRARDRAGQRLRLRPRGIGVDRRPPRGRAHRAGAARGHGVGQRPPARPDGRPRPVGRGRGRRARADTRRDRPARLRAGEADHLGPLGRARAVVGAVRRAAGRAAHAVARLRSARDSDRERAWRQAASGSLARVGARAPGARPVEPPNL